MKPILERMRESPLIFDGAMGTMLYERGVFLNSCFDELCLSNPKLVRQIHQEYADAGAEVIETNTFGANRVALRGYGLGDKVEAINRAAVRIAREVAGDSVYVAGAVGPCIRADQIMQEGHAEEVEAAFAEQIGALADEGVDLVVLETFTRLTEARIAAQAARRMPVTVAVDAMGGDHGPWVTLAAALTFLERTPDARVIAVGLDAPLRAALALGLEILDRLTAIIRQGDCSQ